MQISKPYVFFHSPRSKYSQEVLSIVHNKNLMDKFTIVNIDNQNYTIPSFVDRVPLLFIQASKEIVVDDNITNYLLYICQNQPGQPKANNSSQQMEYLSDVNKSISNSFSFISENDDTITPLGYGIIGDSPSKVPTDFVDSSNKSNKLDSQVFENYKSQRDNDIAQFMPPRTI